MPITVVTQTRFTGGNTGGTSSALNTTGANLLVLTISPWSEVSGISVSDSKGNTWNALTNRVGIGPATRIYYCVPSSVGSGHTFTVSASANFFGQIGVLAISGAAASPLYSEIGGTGNSPLSAGMLSPPEDGCLIVTSVCTYTSSHSHSIGGGFTSSTTNYVSGVTMGGGYAYLIQSAAAAVTPTWTWTNSTGAAASALFLPAAESSSGGSPLLAIMQQYSLSGGCL